MHGPSVRHDPKGVPAREGEYGRPRLTRRRVRGAGPPVDRVIHIEEAALVPVEGEVIHIRRQPGRFFAAYRGEASSSNARTEVAFRHNDGMIVCRQIVGVLARRIVCRVRVGQKVQAGDRFGIMKFGSRIDLFIPRTATIAVVPGQRVRGGESVVARLMGAEKPETGF